MCALAWSRLPNVTVVHFLSDGAVHTIQAERQFLSVLFVLSCSSVGSNQAPGTLLRRATERGAPDGLDPQC